MKILYSIYNTLLLRPHGDSLLLPESRRWTLFTSILAITLAGLEGSTWSKIFEIALPEYHSVSIVVFILIFIVIWILDATFITSDSSKPIYQLTRKSNFEINNNNVSIYLDFSKWNWNLSFSLIKDFVVLIKELSVKLSWLVFWVGGRIAIITFSAIVTAPTLGGLLLEKEILNKLDEENNKQRAQLIYEVEKKYRERENILLSSKEKAQNDLEQEVAGKKGSGKYGIGKVAEQIRYRIEDIKQSLIKLESQKNMEIDSIKHLSLEKLQSNYGITVRVDSVRTRKEIQESLSNDYITIFGIGTFSGTSIEKAVIIFVFAVFLGMVLLKMTQPRSVKIYYNQELQEMYLSYCKGLYDNLIDTKERYTGIAPMNPLRFQEWVYHYYLYNKNNDERNAEKARLKAEKESRISQLSLLENEKNSTLNELESKLETLVKDKNNIDSQYDRDVAALSELQERSDRELLELSETMIARSKTYGYEIRLYVERTTELQKIVDETKRNIRDIKAKIKSLCNDSENIERSIKDIENRIKIVKSEILPIHVEKDKLQMD